MRNPWRRLGGTLVTAAALLLLGAGCATAPEAPPGGHERFFADAAFAAPARPVDVAEVFAMSPAMERYLKVEIAPLLRQMGRQRGLIEALHSRAHLRLEYDNAVTRNAAEAFNVRAGNCLSLVVMTAALAKALDLPISYQALVGHDSWSRSGALTFINGHVNIAIARRLIDRVEGIETDAVRLSFGSPGAGRGAALRTVEERTIVAMFMNNRAAEALLAGDADQAYAYAREAVRQDPRYAGAYNTLGVIYRQRGLHAPAEAAWRQTLALETEQRAALANLALLFEAQGRAAEAAPLRQALARLEAEPPFQQFDLGREAIARRDYAAARMHIEREMKRDPDYHEFHYWLAIALAGLGDSRAATTHLARARDNSTTREDQAIYAGKIEKLKRLIQ
jgi:tetratricopeptide (TPR) repeat protein